MKTDIESLAAYIDHTLLRAAAGPDQIRTLCREAAEYGFAAVCLHPVYVSLAADLLRGTETAVCTVVSFPLGSAETGVKVFEAASACRQGAAEIDMVACLGALKSGDWRTVTTDIAAVVSAVRDYGARVKVIIETGLLNKEEKERACASVVSAGADFVKTSTGFGPGGAVPEDVEILAAALAGSGVLIKAAGGIRTCMQARRLIDAGAARLGTSCGPLIMLPAEHSGEKEDA